MQFFVKVRIDGSKLQELGSKLASGAIDVSAMQWTLCVEQDLTVGMSLWHAADRDELERKIAPLRAYYAEVMEITPVVTSPEAKARLLANRENAKTSELAKSRDAR
jgi:hypothetical protein